MKTVFGPSGPIAPDGLLALLRGRQFFAADLYAFALTAGPALYYCSGDRDISWRGIVFRGGGQVGPYFDRRDRRSKCNSKIGLQADTLSFDVMPGAALVGGVPFLVAVREGVFDGADLTLYRAFMPSYGDVSNGLIILFAGRVAEVDGGRTVITITAKSHLELLDMQLPRNLYQPGCVNALGDTSCGVDLTAAAYHADGIVQAGSTNAVIAAYLVSVPQQGAFDLGTIAFTSGTLSGQSYSVKRVVYGQPHQISLTGYALAPPSAGDTFRITYGCDKTPGFSSITITGLTSTGVPAIGNPSTYAGIAPGMSVAGPGIPAGTTVLSASPLNIYLSAASTHGVTSGSFTFTAPPGQPQNGCVKFNNLVHFRGFPFTPQPVTAA